MSIMRPRKRHQYLVLGSIFVLFILLLTDPDTGLINQLPLGASTIAAFLVLIRSIYYIGLLHLSRKYIFDYLDIRELVETAKTTAEGAGHLFIGTGLWAVAFALVIWGATH